MDIRLTQAKRLPKSFSRQIMILVSIGIIVLALVSSLLTSWVVSKRERTQLVSQSLQVAESLAEQSILAMLFGSPENAEDAVSTALDFPNIVRVSLRQPSGSVLLDEGDEVSEPFVGFGNLPSPNANLLERAPPPEERRASIVHETSSYVYICAPIRERRLGDDSALVLFGDETAAMPEVIGFADMVVSKTALNEQRRTTIIQNTAVSLVLALLMLLVLNKIISRITTPLRDLSTLMREQDAEHETSRADIKGPMEIQDMARAFNSMMDVLDERDFRLRFQNDTLENQVRARTRELMDARDAAIQASKHKSAFLANMSHELRTPLNAVLGYTSMVIEDVRSEEFSRDNCVDDLERVENAGHHLLSMINNILDLAKIEAGRMELEFDEVKIKQLARQVEDTILPLIHNGNNKLDIQLTAHTESIVIDPTKLRQVLVNLLSNASKFTKDGVITLKIDYSEDALACSVSDTGIGMNQAQQERIFKAFRQADMTTTKTFGGTGLGLTISQRLCTLMGATINVESEEDKGTRFYFTIPLPMEEHQEDLEQLAS